MEAKHNNPNSEIILASELNPIEPFFFLIVKIVLKNESYKFFFQIDAWIA